MDTDRVRIWDAHWPAGHTVPLHVHPTDTVAVILEGGTTTLVPENGPENTGTYAEKDIAFISAGTAHAIRVGDGSPRVMFYELKN